MGNDLNNCDVKTDTSQECQELCAETEGCVQFTWLGYAVGDNEDSKHKCCLKNAYYDDRQSHGGLVSGPKVCGKLAHNWKVIRGKMKKIYNQFLTLTRNSPLFFL